MSISDHSATLGALVPGLEMLGGGPKVDAIPSLYRHTIGRHLPATWAEVAQISVGDLLTWNSVGVGKIEAFVDYLKGLVGEAPFADTLMARDTLRAVESGRVWLQSVVTDAVEGDISDLLSAVVWAIHDSERGNRLAAVELPRIGVSEWMTDVQDVRSRLDARTMSILDARLLEPSTKPITLQQLADMHQVTRERIRQIEEVGSKTLRSIADEGRYMALRHARRRIGELGAAFPVREVGLDTAWTAVERTLLWLVGPYHIDQDWAVLARYDGRSGLAMEAFQTVADNGVAFVFDYFEALADVGVNREHVDDVGNSIDLELVGDQLIFPGGGMGDRAVQRLTVVGRPMSLDELFEGEKAGRSRSGFANAVQSSPKIVRTGKNRYALREWGDSEYPGILPAMVARLQANAPHPLVVRELADELEAEYGVAGNSIHMYATMHPLFVSGDGLVRLRATGEPYEPDVNLADTASCFLIDGQWSFRVLVDRDILRGSGRHIPEAFAVHLGGQPLVRGQLRGPNGEISIGWDMNPWIGSVRREAASLGLGQDDYIFVRRTSPTSLDFVGVRSDSLDSADPADRVKALVGAPADPRPWKAVLAEALGVGGATEPDERLLLRRLQRRGDEEVASMVEELLGTT